MSGVSLAINLYPLCFQETQSVKCQTAAMMLMPGIAKAVQATCGTFELATQTDNKTETSERESEMPRCFSLLLVC